MIEKVKTPWITWFKEVVTASICILVISALLYFLTPHIMTVPPDVQSATAIFSMFGGWSGGILGYYLGRVPSERAAVKAEAAALTAEKAKDAAQLDLRKNILQIMEQVSSDREKLETYLVRFAKSKELADQL